MRIKMYLILALCFAAACAPMQEPISEPATPLPDSPVTSPPQDSTPGEPPTNPYEPQPGDSAFTRGNVFIQETDLIIRESFPPQIALVLRGELPTPCHQLRVQVEVPDANNRIDVEAYTVVNPDLVCIQVIEPFEASLELGTFPSGHYSVWVNGELVGEFDS